MGGVRQLVGWEMVRAVSVYSPLDEVKERDRVCEGRSSTGVCCFGFLVRARVAAMTMSHMQSA